MKKVILVLFSVMGLFLIAGCQESGNDSGGWSFPGSGGKGGSSSYFGGNPDGISIKFLNLQPPDVLREGQDFTVALEIVNNAQCSTSGQICVRDALSDIFGGLQDNCQDINLKGVENVNGQIIKDSKILFFRGNSYADIKRELNTQIIAKAVYSCEIISGPQLCIKPLIGENENLCKSTESISGKSLKAKSAPITITKVDKEIIPEQGGIRLLATITLTKMSKGQLKTDIGNFDADKGSPLSMSVEYAGFGEMKCNSLDGNTLYWKPKDATKTVQCELELGQIDLIENPLNIGLSYDYEVTESKQITIKQRFDS